jgi:hypothetical protein
VFQLVSGAGTSPGAVLEALIWEVWRERFRTPLGFTNYLRTRTLHLPSGDVLACEIITGRPEVIIEDIRTISPSDAGVDPQSD